jgi:alanine dehydrogenase
MLDVITADDIDAALPWSHAIGVLRAGFLAGHSVTTPQRHHHSMGTGDDSPTLLLMPSWSDKYAGVKLVTVFPTNRDTDIATINGNYLLLNGTTGVPLAILDGGALTARRTAAASILAATMLARAGSRRLVVVGSGRLAAELARGYCALFPIDEIIVWNHRPPGAEQLAATLRDDGLPATSTTDLGAACATADIVTCATMSSTPVVLGDWLNAGCHLDLVGAFTPAMREADDVAISQARVFVDTMVGALTEAGDILQPIASGVLSESDIEADLFSLCRGFDMHRADDDITLFKSVGHALEDLVSAAAVYETLAQHPR